MRRKGKKQTWRSGVRKAAWPYGRFTTCIDFHIIAQVGGWDQAALAACFQLSWFQKTRLCVCVKWMFFNLLFLLYWPSQALGISTCHSCTESSFALFFKLFVLVCVCVCVSQSICRWHEGVQAGLMTANSWTWLTGFQNQKISGGGG